MNRYYTICGTWEYAKAEDWTPEALLKHHVITVAATSYNEAVKNGELMVEGHPDVQGYLIPQAFDGRLYNLTEHDVPVDDRITLYRQEKLEWQNYRQTEV